MPLPDITDLTPPYGSRLAFLLAAAGTVISGLHGMLANVIYPADISPAQHIEFLVQCVYALSGCIVAMAVSGVLLLKWLGTRFLKVLTDNSKTNGDVSKTNGELSREIEGLRDIMEVQMSYFNSAGIKALMRTLGQDTSAETEVPDLPISLSTAARRPAQPKTKRHNPHA